MSNSVLRRVQAHFNEVNPETGLTRGQQIRGNIAMRILGPYILWKGYRMIGRRSFRRSPRQDGHDGVN